MALMCRQKIVDFCQQHPLFMDGKEIVIGRGQLPCRVLFIGEAPGFEENKQGIPFCEKSGEILNKWIESQELQKDAGVTNSVFLLPLDDEHKIRKPTNAEIADFKPYLDMIIEESKPKMIICVGSSATETISGKKISEMEGKSIIYKNALTKFIKHPAWYLRQGQDGLDDFKKLFDYQRVLIYDTEDWGLDPEKAKLRFVGAYSYDTQQQYFYQFPQDKEKIQQLFDTHDVLVGFNNREYDNPILKNHGFNLRGCYSVDILKGLWASGRKSVMGLQAMEDDKLDTLVRFLNLGVKTDIDYNIFEKDEYTTEEIAQIKSYLDNDIIITKQAFDWWANWCKPFAEYVSPENKRSMQYMTCSVASYAYKAICYANGIPEEYDEQAQRTETFIGAFVSCDVEQARGNLVAVDFSSLYPHIMFQTNLLSPFDSSYSGKVFGSNAMFPHMHGRYKAFPRGKIEETLLRFYKLRKEYKKAGDSREYAIKILLNSFYGAMSNPVFKNVHNPTGGPDTTYIGQQCVKHARESFKNEGFTVLYTDTDSVYVALNNKQTMDDVHHVRKQVVEDIKKNLPLPSDTFDLSIDKKLKYFQAFKDENTGELLKKFYVCVTDKDDVIVKGLPIVKSNCSALSKHVFEKLKPEIISTLNCQFKREKIDAIVQEAIKNDVTILAKLFKVKSLNFYKLDSDLGYKISKHYGTGNHRLIKNFVCGVGGRSKYCTVAEAKKLAVRDFDLSSIWKELHYFVKDEFKQTNLQLFTEKEQMVLYETNKK